MLNFEYNNTAGAQESTYRGYNIRAVLDTHSENPWTSWDCEPPLAVNYDGHTNTYSTEYGDPLDPLAAFSDGQINRHWKAICAAFEGVNSWGQSYDLDIEARELFDSWGQDDLTRQQAAESRADARRETLANCDMEDFDFIAELWGLIGVPALSTTSRGYSQGDYAELLIVLTPEIVKAWGTKPGYLKQNSARMMQASAELYTAWAWGDVYGYTVTDSTGEDVDASVWGFYGSDLNKSGLAESVMGEIDSEIESRRHARADKLKTFIKCRVPLYVRQAAFSESLPL